MSRIEKIEAEARRAAEAATWEERMNSLRTRKENPKHDAQFCRDHGLSHPQFCRNKSGKTIPTQETVDAVTAAFHAEGV